VIAVLIAVTVAFIVAVFATPIAIGYLRRHHIGAQIRDDGPVAHPHEAKAGTPTMGGVALVFAAFLGYIAAHIRSEAIKFADNAIALWILILGMFAVGFIDDYLGVRKARNLGLRKRGKTFGILLVVGVFAFMATQMVHVNTHLSFTQGSGHGGSHPHLAHEFVRSIVEGRAPFPVSTGQMLDLIGAFEAILASLETRAPAHING